MKRSWVLADGDRKKKPSTISASKASDAQPPCGSSAPDESRVPLSKSDSDMIQGYVDIMNRIKHQTENISPEVGVYLLIFYTWKFVPTSILSLYFQLMKEMAQSVMFKTTSLSSESRRSLKKVLEERTMLFANNLSEFVHLSKGDQVRSSRMRRLKCHL